MNLHSYEYDHTILSRRGEIFPVQEMFNKYTQLVVTKRFFPITLLAYFVGSQKDETSDKNLVSDRPLKTTGNNSPCANGVLLHSTTSVSRLQ